MGLLYGNLLGFSATTSGLATLAEHCGEEDETKALACLAAVHQHNVLHGNISLSNFVRSPCWNRVAHRLHSQLRWWTLQLGS